ncbi:hypothetical protein Cgig2_004133 [Carnegiea gigantea]|uniref:JmjC domain-containing protein n=1 Tax=Carnegiea gigantea TaxID=171969 RepID=A0A9Q1KT28_9CARY|nr:hypothetical protein Cgig2_004133 [Carnegiea gigantea]
MEAQELKKGLKLGGKMERVNGKELSYTEFVARYLAKNQPVVVTGIMDDWRACKDWVDLNGHPNLRFFSTHFGKSKVQIADCGSQEFTDQRTIEMSVSEFIEYWVTLNEENKRVYHSVSGDYSDTTNHYDGKPLLYLKDWHFVKEYTEYVAYSTPLFFNDDWLNLYLDEYHMHNDPEYQEQNEVSCSDYRFVYMGPKGTWTPLHADVFRSYSWSANVCGRKLWLFLPPDQCHLVFDRYMKNSLYNIFDNVNESKFPGFKKAVWLECTQLKNEIIFVPSGWYHQVHNLEDTISINHNWFNAYNLDWVWNLLVGDYNEAKELIEDIRDICDDFEALCQRNLAANTGMNLLDFFTFITRMTFANLVQLCNHHGGCEDNSPTSCPSAHHSVLNLISIRRVALKMNSTCLVECRGSSSHVQHILEDPVFLELCSALRRRYEKLHEECHHENDDGKSLVNVPERLNSADIVGSTISNSENLISFINRILGNFLPLLDDSLVSELVEENSAVS